MIKYVIKRDGKKVPFEAAFIVNAVMAAQEELGQSDYSVANTIADEISKLDVDVISIPVLQGYVETALTEVQPDVARGYIEYRAMRDRSRDAQSTLGTDILNLLKQTDKTVANENANKDAKVFPVQRDLIAGLVSKHFGRSNLPNAIVKAHDGGDIHYHDLDYSPFLPMTNCCLVDLKKLLEEGFRLGNASVESPRSIGVACAIVAQITAQVASHQYGGTTFAHIDKVLAPYVLASWNKHHQHGVNWGVRDASEYADAMTEKEVYDGIQALEYEVNTLFSTNGQTPFVTVTFGTGLSKHERWIQEAILKVRLKGLGKEGITAVFPKLVMFLEEGINLKPEDPNYDIKQLALECSAKRLYPDIISSKINRSITGSSIPVSPMGCRSFLSVWKDEHGKEVLDGRNNLGVVSLNLPRIAIKSGGDWDKFYKLLEKQMEVAVAALHCRIDCLRGVKASVAPILYTEGAFGVNLKPDDDIMQIFEKGRASISMGYIGLHEVGMIMSGKHPKDCEETQNKLIGIVSKLKGRMTYEKQKTGLGFSLYSTPSESLCDRFCRLDKAMFGEIKGITDKGWYTNSFHLDVDRKVTPFEKIDYEAAYHTIAGGGHISYAEFPELKHNLKALESVWDYAMSKLAYFGTNTPSDLCYLCGFDGEFDCTSKGFNCPNCGNHDSEKMNVIRRVCGYLGAPTSRGFNAGKQAECEHRVKHL